MDGWNGRTADPTLALETRDIYTKSTLDAPHPLFTEYYLSHDGSQVIISIHPHHGEKGARVCHRIRKKWEISSVACSLVL